VGVVNGEAQALLTQRVDGGDELRVLLVTDRFRQFEHHAVDGEVDVLEQLREPRVKA
jgi:hypothetical protein